MNQIVPAVVVPAIGLVPASMSEAIKLAELMATAKLVPQALQKSPADCLMVIQQAVRWQMDPFAVAQECSVIQEKLMHSGKLVAAVVNARGGLAERLSFGYAGTGDARTITVSGRYQGENEPRTVTVKLGDAKTNNKVWQTQPDQQLMYHGTRVWARRHSPELMLGVYSPEEFDEPAGNGNSHAAPAATAPTLAIAKPVEVTADPVTGEVGPRKVEVAENGGHKNWIQFGSTLIAGINAAADKDEVDLWLRHNGPELKAMEDAAPKAHAKVKAAVIGRRQALAPEAPAAPQRLSEADSAALLKALLQKLVKTQSLETLDKWAAETADGRKSLTDADHAVLDEGEDHHREALTPPEDDPAAIEDDRE